MQFNNNFVDRNKVVLVSETDQPLGEMDKLEAHVKGLLHRAFSVFIFNTTGEILLQQRAESKYHGAGLWTNACCSHPQLNENIVLSAVERLNYEMGITCELTRVFSFIYNTPVENNLIEHEFDHVFVGITDQSPNPNREEVQNFKWMKVSDLLTDISENPEFYTYWFRSALPEIIYKVKI